MEAPTYVIQKKEIKHTTGTPTRTHFLSLFFLHSLSEASMAAASASQHSSSRRHFHWTNKVGHEDTHQGEASEETNKNQKKNDKQTILQAPLRRRKLPLMAAFRLQSIRTLFSSKNRKPLFGPRVVGTLFGSKRGHVNFAFQTEPNSTPAFLVELATPISELVKEMASGLVRIALECDRAKDEEEKEEGKEKKEGAERLLVEEPVWRTFCNGKKCGFATRRECGVKEKKILKAVEPISMGAGALPAEDEEGSGEQVMYMRAKFERIVGSRDSEAFYMMNPDSNGAPELSIYLLRV